MIDENAAAGTSRTAGVFETFGASSFGASSFAGYLEVHAPDRLPWRRGPLAVPPSEEFSHGTTVLALQYGGGVLMAGDRRATAGNRIVQNRLVKVHPADQFSAVAFAGSVGISVEMIRLFQVELQHYEKIEGAALSLRGKANRLAAMVRSNLGMAMQGLAMVPLLAGVEPDTGECRIYGYDVVGDVQEERPYGAVGSGSVFARSSLKKLHQPGMSEAEAARIAVEALYDAADDDSATGGPDLIRDIHPIIAVVDADGYREYDGDQAGAIARAVVDGRHARPGGPSAIVPS